MSSKKIFDMGRSLVPDRYGDVIIPLSDKYTLKPIKVEFESELTDEQIEQLKDSFGRNRTGHDHSQTWERYAANTWQDIVDNDVGATRNELREMVREIFLEEMKQFNLPELVEEKKDDSKPVLPSRNLNKRKLRYRKRRK